MDDALLMRLQAVTIGYGRQGLLQNIDLDVSRGDFLALAGPNGAGKSTVLKTMLRIIPPLAGTVWRRPGLRIGYVPQRATLDPIYPLTALEVVRAGGMGPGLRWVSARRDQGMKALERLRLRALAAKPLRELSGGQQRRVLIARALVREPELLVLDEPVAGMDLPSERELLDFVTRLNRQQLTTVVLVVHQISLVAGRATRMALVNKDLGQYASGTAAELLSSETLSTLYGHPLRVVEVDGSVLVRAAPSSEHGP